MIKQLETPSLTGNSIKDKRHELIAYFKNTWSTYESVFALLSNDEAYFLRPEPLRHPLIFYYGHTASFYINKLILGKYIHQRVNRELEAICAVGVDEMSWDDLNSEHYDWPSVETVRSYRAQVYKLLINLIETMELSLPIEQDSLAWVILMGCEHERIHLETSSVLMRMLPLDCINTQQAWQTCSASSGAPVNELITVAAQAVTLGKADTDTTFGWDNEYGQQTIKLEAFSAAKYLVSNQEFLAFVEGGGYQKPEYWCPEGQAWLQYTQATMPRFWRLQQGQYYQRNLVNEIALPLDWPVEVNYLEANAFCQWRQQDTQGYISLPTEAQWYSLRNTLTTAQQGQQLSANINLQQYASSCPINQHRHGDFFDIVGNVWQWTSTAIDGFPGFRVHPLYDDFSTPTFDGKHNLIKGGSWISTGNETLASSRYAFRRHFFQHAGFRYVVNTQPSKSQVPINRFETSVDICQQLDCYFGPPLLNYQNYGQQIAEQVLQVLAKEKTAQQRMLNLACSVGRVAFELSPYFQHIDAVDFSARTIQHGVQLQSGLPVRYTQTIEGEICQYQEVSLASTVKQADAARIAFSQGDGGNLKAQLQHYDVILLQHALEQSYDPKALLCHAISRLNPGGILFVLSDYHYQLSTTAQDKWLGGVKVNGENLSGFDALTEQLATNFDLLSEQELTRVLASSSRNFSLSHCHLTAWRAK
ncbi:5-histidylcysteine sulfoxide synthase/putative 4-mercaptohistidine N1-methyltranferase [Colwellia chukchiensis]|uniref:5-histidylcysteine sulfoxide synthase/putative 4-mercaptohistidine N1-methyltranferase n=1 Tax=Colwellia chukchiensis TaxID=641665 RepID=A0A1H7HVK0_9GAMM|nr:5-histidylcysteine sulfoxide synthase [Colwellia chukchiensis]SEK53677.1 5-histidylcysteine sulfoxide synthase/putative 4-mercaptohistidine N1-methyltranferase [Colwellia chukchiensis]